MPPGTIDPSPFIYNNTMYTTAGLVSVEAMLHLLVRPVNPKYLKSLQLNKSKKQFYYLIRLLILKRLLIHNMHHKGTLIQEQILSSDVK